MKDYLLRLHHSPGQVHIPKSTMILAIKKSGYTCRTLEEDADSFCRECLLCQKTTGSPPSNALMGSTLRLKPFETVELDLIGPLPEDSQGHRYILSMIDSFTRLSELAPLKKKDAKSVASAFLNYICLRYTVPTSVMTDWGTEFDNQLMRNISEFLGFEHLFVTPHNPRAMGIVEKLNGVIKKILLKM
ncbi:hypothetical protein ADUPG1_005046, partial [Aduncisulcus paluster]